MRPTMSDLKATTLRPANSFIFVINVDKISQACGINFQFKIFWKKGGDQACPNLIATFIRQANSFIYVIIVNKISQGCDIKFLELKKKMRLTMSDLRATSILQANKPFFRKLTQQKFVCKLFGKKTGIFGKKTRFFGKKTRFFGIFFSEKKR